MVSVHPFSVHHTTGKLIVTAETNNRLLLGWLNHGCNVKIVKSASFGCDGRKMTGSLLRATVSIDHPELDLRSAGSGPDLNSVAQNG